MRWIKTETKTETCWINLRYVIQVHIESRDGWNKLVLFTEHGMFETKPQREPLVLPWLLED